MTTPKNYPVPWVALWSAEEGTPQDNPKLKWTGRLIYDEELRADRRLGVLWCRHRIGKHGDPLFGQLHTARQRLAMLKSLCQVCGDTAINADGRTSWLVSPVELFDGNVAPWTVTPPTCENCKPVALRHCPHLKSTPPAAVSGYPTPVGVLGDLYNVEGGRLTGVWPRSHVSLQDDERLRRTLAKQLAVQLTDVQVDS